MLKQNDTINGTYKIIKQIGHGGAGIVYLAYHIRLEKYIAVKQIAGLKAATQQLRLEADILKNLHHTNLPQVYDFLEMDGQVYTVMDYISGKDLQHYIDIGAIFDENQIIKWLVQLCDVLHYLHTQPKPILHCDIKPGNIIVTEQGDVCLIDFNISLNAGEETAIRGYSQYYAAPEQITKAALYLNGKRHQRIVLDERTDLYSLAATFYHLLSGNPPILGQASVPLCNLEMVYSDSLINILDKAMCQNPRFRYSNAEKMKYSLVNLHKQSSAYKKQRILQAVTLSLSVAMVLLGIYSIAHGQKLQNIENYTQDYMVLQEYCVSGAGSETISQGIKMLNRTSYQSILANRKDQQAGINHMIGEAYYIEDDFNNALIYFAKAAESQADIENRATYYRDYAVVLAALGKTDDAFKALSIARSFGLKDAQVDLVQAQVLVKNGELAKALEKLTPLCDLPEKDLSQRAGLLLAEIYLLQEKPERAAECLEMAKNFAGLQKNQIRKLGMIYSDIALKQDSTVLKKHYYNKSLACFKELAELKYPFVEDQISLAIAYYNIEEYGKSKKKLMHLQNREPEDYRIPMYLTRICFEMKDFSEAAGYCKTAKKLYEKTQNEFKSQDDGEIIEQLKHLLDNR